MPEKHEIKIAVCYVAITPLRLVNDVFRFEATFILLCSYFVFEING